MAEINVPRSLRETWPLLLGRDIVIRQDALYTWLNEDDDPDEIFALIKTEFQEVKGKMEGQLCSKQEEAFDEYMANAPSEMIFGSNLIERAGGGYELTIELCKEIFIGKDVLAVIKSLREMVQHTLALKHIVEHMVVRNRNLTEELILATHKILCDGIETSDYFPPEEYAGKY
jgi:hypothetical protein